MAQNHSLLEQQNQLHEEGQQVLDELALVSELERYGKPLIVGSFALELLTRRDIDIEVIVEFLDKSSIRQYCSYLASLDVPRIDITLMDNRLSKNPNLPNSLYVGVIYLGRNLSETQINDRSLAWQIDIHFLKEQDAKGATKLREIQDKLTPEKRLSILTIKQAVGADPKYHKEVFSIDIYDAVLNHGVEDLESFKHYMREKGIEL